MTKTQQPAPTCFFVNCTAHVEFRFWRLWNQALPVQHCCADHMPGSRRHLTPAQLKDLHQPTDFYRVERIVPPHETRKALRDATLAVGRGKA